MSQREREKNEQQDKMLSTMLKQQEQQQQTMMMLLNQQQQQSQALLSLFQGKTQLFLLFSLWIHSRSVLSQLSIFSTFYQLKYCVSTVVTNVIFNYLLRFLHWQHMRTRKPFLLRTAQCEFWRLFPCSQIPRVFSKANCKVFHHMITVLCLTKKNIFTSRSSHLSSI